MCFSMGLDRTDRRDIGRKFTGSDISLDFGRGITLASLSTDGKMSRAIHKLYAYVRGSTIWGRDSFNIKADILSGPIDVLFLSCEISCPTSCTPMLGIRNGTALLSLELQCCLRC